MQHVLKHFTVFTWKHLCWSFFLIKLKALRPETLLKQTPTQVFSCEYCSVFKNNFFEEQDFLIMTIWLLFLRKFAKLSRRNQLF